MTSSLWRFGITLAFLGFASTLPATVGAQPPVYLTQWGSYGSGNGEFYYPLGVATDAAGDVYVTDQVNQRIQKFTSTGTYLTQWGSPGSGDGQFDHPNGITTDAAGDVYVTDYNNHRIQKFTGTGTYLTQWGSLGTGDGQFDHPNGVTTDAGGDIYVADAGNNRIKKFTGTGTFLTQWGSQGSGDGQFFNGPFGVATDAAGNVYVTDYNNHRIQKFTGAGTYLTQWGSQGSSDGQFSFPVGVSTDAAGNVYVADAGNHRIQKFGPAPTPIAMAFYFTPSTLSLASRGLWVTGFLEPASPSAASGIDISSIRLNGTVPVDAAAPTALGDHDGNGVTDLMVKFNRAAVELTVSEGDNVPVIVTGTLGSDPFSGTDNIRVSRAVVLAPPAGSHLAAGSVTQVRWQMPSGFTVESVGLLYSPDGGSTWSLIARGQPNTGNYDWTVPNVLTDQAKVAVVESADETGTIVDGVLGVSETFSIAALVSVGDGAPAQFALRGVTPNPARHELQVSFSLRDSKAASMALFDVSGRQLAARRVDGMGPGWHTVTLGGRSSLPAGLYIIRLTQDGRSLTTRAAVVR
jgi:NHL repeat-containing protein